MALFKTLGGQVRSGFLLLSLILLGIVLTNIWGVNKIATVNARLMTLSAPTANTSEQMLTTVYRLLAAMRGRLLLNKTAFEDDKARAWQAIEDLLERMRILRLAWTDTENISRLRELEVKLEALETRYQRMDELVLSSQIEQAINLFNSETIPLTTEITVLLTAMRDSQQALMDEDASLASAYAVRMQYLQWVLLVMSLVLGLTIATVITRRVAGPIAAAVKSAERIAEEDFGFHVDLRGSEEIEQLGAALEQMKHSLRKRRWLIASQLGLLETMAADLTLHELANASLRFICERFNAQLGAFYLCEQGELHYLAGYAQHAEQVNGKSLKFGEGMLGQVALSQQMLSLQDLPPNYFTLYSALGEMCPRSLLIFPVILNDSTRCVLELATKAAFKDEHVELLKQAMRNIGIGVDLCIAKEKTQKLLEEVQTQSEELMQSNEELEQKSQELEAQQEELQQTNEELEEQRTALEEEKEKLELMTHELEVSRGEIERKATEAQTANRYKSEFLANMSHELRTPLNSIMILSQVLAENTAGNLQADQIKNARTIYSAGGDLLNLINDILDLSKVEAGKLDIYASAFSLEELGASLQATFEPQMRSKNLRFTIEQSADAPTQLHTDQGRLQQIIKNLISNALKFTEQGEVRVRFSRDGNFLHAAVQDSGIGIPAGKQALVFEAFKQVDSSLSRKYGGTGLGLSISQNLARMLGGEIELRSDEGQGSCFTLRVPIEYQGQSENILPSGSSLTRKQMALQNVALQSRSDLENDPVNIRPGDRVILIVEDDVNFAKILIQECRAGGFKCLHADTGARGLADAKTFLPHAIILDLRLPEMNGMEVLDQLKTDPKTRHIPVHVMSVENRADEVMRLGAMGFLEKPVSKLQLDHAIREIEQLSSRITKNVLLVEDNEAQRDSILQLFQGSDIKINTASSVAQARTLLAEHHYDCMILDLKLRHESGLAVLEALRQDAQANAENLPVVVYTGKDLTPQELHMLKENADSVIIKSADSHVRLLDEVTLFLHSVDKRGLSERKTSIRQPALKEELFAGKTILIVDDDVRNIYSLRQILLSRGFETLEAGTGREALNMLEQHACVDLVLMDIMMPEMSGIEAIKALRGQLRFKKLPVIALTAKAMKQDRDECLQAGASDYLAKPVDINQLISLLRIWLAK